MTKFPPYSFVAVEWHDSSSPDATAIYDAKNLKDAHGEMPVITCGWLLKEDDQGVTLASEWFAGTTEFRGLTCILKVNIVERVELKAKGPARPRKATVTKGGPDGV